MSDRTETFRDRLRAGEMLIGTWVKTPCPDVCEVLCATELDVLCLDAEHAPFDRAALDACIRVLRAGDMPCLVRVPDANPTGLQQALDSGATGVVVPHVTTRQDAEAIARACHFGSGGRGYAGSTRAAGFGSISIPEHLRLSRARTTVVAQIEDAEALAELDDIAACDDVDALFIGRIDLTVSLGESRTDAPRVLGAVQKICDAARSRQRSVGMFFGDLGELAGWRAAGASLFLLESDQAFLRQGAAALLARAHAQSD